MFAVVYARMGTGIIAAINIFATVERVSMVIFFGLAQAATVMKLTLSVTPNVFALWDRF
jgi:Na+-driven multidrug efflux pump